MKKKLCLILFVFACILFSISGASKDDDLLLSYIRKVSIASDKKAYLDKTKKDLINKKISQKFYYPLCDKMRCYGGARLVGEYRNKEYIYIKFRYNNCFYLIAGILSKDTSVEIKDILVIDKNISGQQLIMGFCSKNELSDEKIIAIVKDDDVEIYTTIYESFSFDTNKEKFIVISNSGISCENVGYGE